MPQLRFLFFFLLTTALLQGRPPRVIDPNDPQAAEMMWDDTESPLVAQDTVHLGAPITTSHSTADPTPAPATATADERAEKIVFEQINHYREGEQLPALELNSTLTDLARRHSEEMARHKVPMGHEGYHDRFKEAREKIANVSLLGENVAMHPKDERAEAELITETVQHWIASPVHHHNIVENYNLTGVGVYTDSKGTLYFTQIFAKEGF